jgi:hypothetical protein
MKDDGETLEIENNIEAQIDLSMNRENIIDFFPILQQGFYMPAQVPCTVRDILSNQFGLSNEYISERITTIFIDGKAIDSLDDSVIRNNSIIALSAAMPGVVGATMRRGSYYAALRGAITCTDTGKVDVSREGMVCVKLFNMLLTEVGPEFLKKGIIMTATYLSEFFLQRPDSFWQGCIKASINGAHVTLTTLKQSNTFSINGTIRLSITFI